MDCAYDIVGAKELIEDMRTQHTASLHVNRRDFMASFQGKAQ